MRGAAYLIADLGFGDSGKGLLTDHLVRRTGARLVVRYNGGAQAGHNVVTPDGRHHTFAQLGAGSFVPGVRTFLSRFVVVHPTALLAEAAAAERAGIGAPLERLRLSARAKLVTPFHQAVNRLRELSRKDARHGSCGVGVGEVVEDAQRHPGDALFAGDLLSPERALAKLASLRERKRAEVEPLLPSLSHAPMAARELALLEAPDVATRWLEQASAVAAEGLVAEDELLRDWLVEDGQKGASASVVFEGAQGVLLDQSHGFFPHMTWSDCTFAQAEVLLSETGLELRPIRVGVLRAHAMRHGAGPLPTWDADVRPRSDHNGTNAWQGAVRYGAFDAVLARYALRVVRGVDLLALTHLDSALSRARFPFADAYLPSAAAPFPKDFLALGQEGPRVRNLVPAERFEEARARALTAALGAASAERSECHAEEPRLLSQVEALLGRPVDLVSRGPTSEDVRWRTSAPEPG